MEYLLTHIPGGGIQVYISAYSDDFQCTQFDRHHDMQTHKQLWKMFAVYICKKYVYTNICVHIVNTFM